MRATNYLNALTLCGALLAGPAFAQDKAPVNVTSGVRYEFIARWDVTRLNAILTQDMP